MPTMVGERQYPVRMPMELYEQIEQLARAEERSVNWVMVRLIREAVEARRRPSTPPAD